MGKGKLLARVAGAALALLLGVAILVNLNAGQARAEEPQAPPPDLEMVYFYPRIPCLSCDEVDSFAQEVAVTYDGDGIHGIPYTRLAIDDPANSERVDRYGVLGSSLFLVDHSQSPEELRELKQVWFLWQDKEKCSDYVRAEIGSFLRGESPGGSAGNPWAGIPLLAAFALGLLASISPCAIGTNVTALAYISGCADDKKKTVISGSMYTAGRALSYIILGLGLVYLGISITGLSRFLRNSQYILGPFFILAALVMLDVLKLKIFSGRFTAFVWKKLPADRLWGSFMLGTLFALVFCPYDAVLFFGVLIPLAIKTIAGGVTLPAAYALGTGLPVLILALLFSLGASRAWKSAERAAKFEKYARKVAGVIFLGAGIYYIVQWIW